MSASASKKVIIAALLGNTLIAITKFTAAAFTGSSAMLSEGIHSLVDTGNQILLLYGMKRAQQPPSPAFPFGHGKEIYFWAFVVAIMIFAVGAGVSIYEGIHHILHPRTMENVLLNYLVLGAAIVFEGGAWFFAFREFKRAKGARGYIEAVQRGKDPTLFVVLFEDSAALLGLLVAITGIALVQWSGNPVFDGIASVIIGLILGGTAIWLAVETKGLLIGESAGRHVVEEVRRLAAGQNGVEHVNEVLTMHMGPEFILINISVDVSDSLPAGRLEASIAELDRQLKAAYPEIKRVFVEAEKKPA